MSARGSAAAFDVAVIGAGAAGMMCAAVAGQRGLRVVLIDHASALAEKIRISGGGRCNFTNRDASPAQYLSANPAFCRSALARYTPTDFLDLLRRHNVHWHEKHRGQLFCDDSAEDIIEMLRRECATGRVTWRMPCAVQAVRQVADGFVLDTAAGPINASRVVVATGGLAIPKLGATGFGLDLARQFGLRVVDTRAGLVPLQFDPALWAPYAGLSGVALEVDIAAGPARKGGGRFREDLLFTHRGLSGPAVLQASSFWQPGTPLRINLLPELDVAEALLEAKAGGRQQLQSWLGGLLPRRVAECWGGEHAATRLADLPDRHLRAVASALNDWQLLPSGTAGYRKAEVMVGGVDTRDLDQQSLMARAVPGLHFIGEVVDVTGWLGGYNFQWAWASAVACARAL